MFRRLATALLIFAVTGGLRPIVAQSFEGVLRQRTIEVSLDALADRGFDTSDALFDVPIEDLLAMRVQLESLGDMVVRDDEILIKGVLMRMDASDEEGPGHATVDLAEGVIRMVRPEEGIYIEMTRADMEQMAELFGAYGDETPEVNQTGRSKTINGMSATAYDVMSSDGLSRVWVSNDDVELADSFREVAELISTMTMGDAPDPAMMVAEYGIPVLVQTMEYDLYRIEETMSVARRAVSAEAFGMPDGLQRMTIQDMMGGMMPPSGSGVSGADDPSQAGGVLGALMSDTESPPAWIEYDVTGAWSASGREEDVVMCTDTGDQFLARSLGDVIIDLEADGHGEGRHEMSVYVARATGARSEGRGTLTIRATGEESFGMSIYEVDFETSDLESTDGVVVAVRGSLMCAAM